MMNQAELDLTSNCESNSTSMSGVSQRQNINDSALVNSEAPIAMDWQSTRKNSKECLEHILANKIYCDVQFIVGSDTKFETFSAHKLILSMRSIVFHTMFNEKWSAECSEVEVTDVECVAFKEMLHFLYTDEVSFTPENVTPVLYAARKYAILALENECIKFLKNMICSTNVFKILIKARLYGIEELVKACLNEIGDNTVKCINTADFPNIDIETLCLVLERSDLRICEEDLFDAVIRWARTVCKKSNLSVEPKNQRSVLKNVLSLIRFPTMNPEVFASKVVDSGVLTEEEINSVTLYFIRKSEARGCIFNRTPRKTFLIADRFTSVVSGDSYGYADETCSHSVIFNADQDIKLYGFGLYGSPDEPKNYLVETTVEGVGGEDSEPLAEFSDIYDGSKKIFRVMFDEPLNLSENTNYVLEVKIQGYYYSYGCHGIHEVCVKSGDDDIFIKFINPDDITSEDERGQKSDANSGQIPQLYFEV